MQSLNVTMKETLQIIEKVLDPFIVERGEKESQILVDTVRVDSDSVAYFLSYVTPKITSEHYNILSEKLAYIDCFILQMDTHNDMVRIQIRKN